MQFAMRGMKSMPRKRNNFSLADAFREAMPTVKGTAIESCVRERYAHQAPACAVAQFERDISDVAKLLIDDNLVSRADVKAALVWCIDDLLITNSSNKDG
jgi:hypothetical protein